MTATTEQAGEGEVVAATTIWYKSKRVWRTLFSHLVTLALLAPQTLAIIQGAWPSEVLTGVLAQAVALQLVVTRIMAIDKVNVWLAHIGLGSAPKAALLP